MPDFTYDPSKETAAQYTSRTQSAIAARNPTDPNTARLMGTAPATPAAPATPTFKDIYGAVSPQDQGIDSSLAGYKTIADTPIDEQGIRDNTMKRLQAEIDATNSVYAEKMRQAHIAGENNLGENAAISARRGLLGSDFGAAQNSKVLNDNAGVYSGIDQERARAIAGITDKGTQLAQQEIANKQTAKQNGATNYISFLSESEKRREARTAQAAKHAIASGIDLSTLSPAELKTVADSYQVAPNALISAYADARNSQAAANAELASKQASTEQSKAATAKDSLINIPYGGSLYDAKSGQTIGGIDGAAKDIVSKALQEGRLDASQITRYGMPFIVSTLESNPSYDFASAHTDYQRGIADSQGVTHDAFGNIISYDTKPQGGAQPITSPTGPGGAIQAPKANAAAVAQSTKKLQAITAAHEKLRGDLAAIAALADKVNARGIPNLDAFINGMTNQYSNNPDLVQFKHLVTSARGDYAVINSGGSASPDQGDQARAAGAIPANGNSAVYNALITTVDGEAQRQIKAQQDTIQSFSSNAAGGTQEPTAPAAPFTWQPTATPQGIAVTDPNGATHTFPSMAQYKAFLAAVNGQ